MHSMIQWHRLASIGLVALASLANSASAGLLATDSYTIGSDPTQGQYAAGSLLKTEPPNQTNQGFVNGAYSGSYTGFNATSNFAVTAGGLAYAPLGNAGPNDGKVSWTGAGADGLIRADARSLTGLGSIATTYWFNMVVSQDGTTASTAGASILAGFGNTVPPVLGSTSAYGNNAGLYFGFAQHGTAGDTGDLVIRYRDTTGKTMADATLVSGASGGTATVFDIVARLDVNANGPIDYLTYWVNPTSYTSQAALDATSVASNDVGAGGSGPITTYAIGTVTDLARLNYVDQNWTGNANFDEARLGTSLADIAPLVSSVPEPGSVVLLGMGLIGTLGLAIRRRARA